uniref:Uncharacterized protein n=1 Tax=Anguilla anguilla TaxID=7936 RepID=A0A0E9VNY9_ANGAN
MAVCILCDRLSFQSHHAERVDTPSR